MKNPLSYTLLIMLLFTACSKQSNEEQTSSADSLASDSSNANLITQVSSSEQVPYNGPPAKYLAGGTYLRIPLTEGWKDPQYILIVKPGNQQVPVYAAPGNPDEMKPTSYISQITQTRWYSEKIMTATHPCTRIYGDDAFRFYEIATGPGNERGWVLSFDVMQVEDLNLAIYSLNDKNLTLASMKTRDRMVLDENYLKNECVTSKTLFLYDDKFLYLIDAPPGNDELSWKFDSFLSLMDHFPMGSVTAYAEGDSYVYTWGVPNGTVRFGVRYEKDYVSSTLYEMTGEEGDFEEGVGEDGDGQGIEAPYEYMYTEEIITEEGIFEGYSIGDCGHMEFSCGDFGNAITELLMDDEEKIWNELVVADNNGESGNPEYVGKNFEIKYKMVPGDRCGDPSGEQYGPIESLISFKLKQ